MKRSSVFRGTARRAHVDDGRPGEATVDVRPNELDEPAETERTLTDLAIDRIARGAPWVLLRADLFRGDPPVLEVGSVDDPARIAAERVTIAINGGPTLHYRVRARHFNRRTGEVVAVECVLEKPAARVLDSPAART